MLNSPAAQADNEKLTFTMGGASGEGYVTTEGFVLLAGAKLNEKVSENSMTNVLPRDDISVIKHGLKIPVDAECYESFVERVKTREQEFVKIFTEMQ